jgi:UDP-GlcNAc:undecaprenyl-phosphate GlcNAc-1-phosphate transferase
MSTVLIVSFVVSLALTPLVAKLAWACQTISRPDGIRRLHARPTPLWGGLAVAVAFLLGLVAAACSKLLVLDGRSLPLCLGLSAGVLCLTGMVDDRFPLAAWGKLPGQLIATLPMLLAGLSPERLSLFGYQCDLGWLAAPWTIAWLLLGMNALNLLDGSDALASTIGLITSLAIAAVAASRGMSEVALLVLIYAGALGGFLVYNAPPARIYLGDGGSTVIGLVLSALALRVSCESPGTANLAILGFLLFVPLLDTSLAILRRMLKGRRIFTGDREHLHHQLRDRGLTSWSIVAMLASLCLTAGFCAYAAACWQIERLAAAVLLTLTLYLAGCRLIAAQEQVLVSQLVKRALRLRSSSATLQMPPQPEFHILKVETSQLSSSAKPLSAAHLSPSGDRRAA